MNINDIAAASAYSTMPATGANSSALRNLSERFAAVFDEADTTAQQFATKEVDTQRVVEALSQAELALQTAVSIRDRVVAAYQEVLRMPI